MTGREALSWAIATLNSAHVDGAERDARKLLANAMGVTHLASLDLTDAMDAKAVADFQTDVGRRANRVPMSHILGQREFYGRSFKVTSDVLDPRPDTETLIEIALEQPFERVLDLGTGSGCILATLLSERPQASGIGTDVSKAALTIAADNIAELGLRERAQLRQGAWFDPIDQTFDLIVSNPPYIALEEMDQLQPEVALHEPRVALTDEDDGLSCYRAITAGVWPYLNVGGRVLVEIGPTQAADVKAMFAQVGLEEITVYQDLDGRDRVVGGTKAPKS